MTDQKAGIAKYVSNPDEEVVASLLKTYRLAVSNADAALVSFGDAAELATVRENFLKKKLGLTQSDAELDAAIAEVGAQMKDGRPNPRLAVYYLLAEKFGKLDALR